MDILEFIGKEVRSNKIKTSFNNGIPGDDSFLLFKKRHRLFSRSHKDWSMPEKRK